MTTEDMVFAWHTSNNTYEYHLLTLTAKSEQTKLRQQCPVTTVGSSLAQLKGFLFWWTQKHILATIQANRKSECIYNYLMLLQQVTTPKKRFFFYYNKFWQITNLIKFTVFKKTHSSLLLQMVTYKKRWQWIMKKSSFLWFALLVL